jgi:hypothetical protein
LPEATDIRLAVQAATVTGAGQSLRWRKRMAGDEVLVLMYTLKPIDAVKLAEALLYKIF